MPWKLREAIVCYKLNSVLQGNAWKESKQSAALLHYENYLVADILTNKLFGKRAYETNKYTRLWNRYTYIPIIAHNDTFMDHLRPRREYKKVGKCKRFLSWNRVNWPSYQTYITNREFNWSLGRLWDGLFGQWHYSDFTLINDSLTIFIPNISRKLRYGHLLLMLISRKVKWKQSTIYNIKWEDNSGL